MRCTMCHRPLTEATVTIKTRGGPLGWGPKCAKKAGLTAPRNVRPRKQDRPARLDVRQLDWVQEVAA